jgi:phage terminase small subunit
MTKRKRKRKGKGGDLTVKQRLFAEYYAECLNGTQSARLAGYKGDDDQLAVTGWQNLRKPKVRAYVDQLLEARKLSAFEVMARISEQATATLEDFIEAGDLEGINTINLQQAKGRGKLHLLKEIKITHGKNGGISIKLHDAQAALTLLAKHYKLLTTVHEIRDWKAEARKAGYEDPDSLFENAKREYVKKLKADDS